MFNVNVEVMMTKTDNHSESGAVESVGKQYINRGYHCCKSSEMDKTGRGNKVCIDAINDKVGAPDLMVWTDQELFFVEVKIYGKGGISCPQMLWYSRHPEAKVIVCFVCFTNVEGSVHSFEECNDLFWSDKHDMLLEDCDKLIEFLYNLWHTESKKVYLSHIALELLPECKDSKRRSLEISRLLRGLGINTRSGTGNYRVVDFNPKNTDIIERLHEKMIKNQQ